MKLLTPKHLAEIIKYTTKTVTTYTDLGVAIPNDLERIVKLLDHITALEAEIKESDSYHNGEHLKDAHRINALEAENVKLAERLGRWVQYALLDKPLTEDELKLYGKGVPKTFDELLKQGQE